MQEAINIAKSGGPSSILQNLASQDPRTSGAMTILQLCNGNLEQAVRTMAQERGIDLNEKIAEFHQCMGRN